MSDEVKATAEAVVETAEAKKYSVEEVQKQLKPLSNNGFLRFFQKIWRWWLGVWYGFCDKHPKLSKILQMAFFFIVFSEGVTIIQFIIMTFLPFAFESMWTQPFVWPAVALGLKDGAGNMLNYAIFNEPVKFLYEVDGVTKTFLASTPELVKQAQDAGYKLQASGLGNFIAFEIAVFIAQCINFPLQRNITYRSHGNPWFQAMWYFIGWLGISISVNALWGICNPLMMSWNWNEVVIGLIKPVITGGLSMVVFFPIFLIIFPDNNKMAKKSKAKYDKLVAANAPTAKIVAAENKMKLWEDKNTKSTAEKEFFQAKSQVNAAVMKYNAIVKASQKENLKEEDKAAYPEKIEKAFTNACNAITNKYEKEAAFNAINY